MKYIRIGIALIGLCLSVEARNYRLEEVDTAYPGITVEKETRIPITGSVSNYTADKQRIAYVEFENGKQNGKEIQWYPTGIKKHEVTWKDGQQIGAWVFWYPSGALHAVHSSDSSIIYNEDGNITSATIYKSGKREEIEFQKPKS